MPRRSGGSRPAPAPAARSAPTGQRSFGTSAAAPPPAARYPAAPAAAAPHAPAQHAPAQAGGQPMGMMGNIMSTAAGVAVGSTVGHGLSSMLFGGSARAEDVPAPVAQQAASEIADSGAQCAIQAKSFTQCLDATASDMQSCSYYFEALKACQQAAAPY